MPDEPRTECRTPTPGSTGVTRIPTWKYDLVRQAILHAVEAAGPEGLAFSRLTPEVTARLSRDTLARLGSPGWHVTTVKLDMEVRGDIRRLPGVSPQRLVRVRGGG
jgi:hypothetical protein